MVLLIVPSVAKSQNDVRATVVSDELSIQAIVRGETAVAFPNASNAVGLNLVFSLPAFGETNPANAPVPVSAVCALPGLGINALPVEVVFNRFIYTFVVTGTTPSMTAWAPMTEHLVFTLTFSAGQAGQIPRLDHFLNGGFGGGQGYFYFEVNGVYRSDTEGDPFYNGIEGSYPGADVYVEATAPLPITLASFTGQKFGERSSLLQWSTASEINSSHFVVQRSTNKVYWTTLGSVDASGNSQIIKNYEFVDENVYNGIDNKLTVYYRLQLVDIDGLTKNSSIESVVFSKLGLTSVREFLVYPNPSSDGVQVEWQTEPIDQPTSLEVYDVTGKLVFTQDVAENSNQEYVDFGLANIKSGMYLLLAKSGDRAIEHKQIVVSQNR